MDPNEALRVIREIAAADMRPWKSRGHWDEVEDLIDHVRALDEWLSKGGFLPEAWAPDPPRDVQAAPSVGTGPYEAARRAYVTGDGKRHASLQAARDHAGDVQASTGQIIAVERAEPLGPPNPAHGELPEFRCPMGDWTGHDGYCPRHRCRTSHDEDGHGLDWRQAPAAIDGVTGTCDCGVPFGNAQTVSELVDRYQAHIRAAGVPDHR